MIDPGWPLPDCGRFDYLVEYFAELRLDFGFQDLKAWSDLTGTELEPWEVGILIDCSATYRGSVIHFRAKKFDTRPPYDGRSEIGRAHV